MTWSHRELDPLFKKVDWLSSERSQAMVVFRYVHKQMAGSFWWSMTEEGNIYILVPQANKEELKLTPYNREPQYQMWLVQQAITVSVQNRQKFHRSQARSWWVEGNCKCMETLIIGLLHVVTCDGLGTKWLMKLTEMRSLELQLSSVATQFYHMHSNMRCITMYVCFR